MSGLIEAFKEFDRNLAHIISVDLEPTIILQDITTGSLKTRIASLLKSVDDAALKELNWKKLVGSFFVKGKYKLIEFLEDKQSIESIEQIEHLNSDLIELAKQADILYLPSFSPIPPNVLLENIKQISDAVAPLIEEDTAMIIAGESEVQINKKFNLPSEKIEFLLTDQIIKTKKELVLKVKKPDFLGYSKWEMKIGPKAISVKIDHQEWLNDFHNQRISVLPGDSIKGLVSIHEHIDQQGVLVAEKYSIIRVDEVIKNLAYQRSLF